MTVYRFKMPIGDYSGDGHGEVENFFIQSNCSPKAIEEAYKKSCRETGLVFTENSSDLNGYDWQHPEYRARRVLVDYEDTEISELAAEILKTHGVAEDLINPLVFGFDALRVLKLFMAFVRISIPTLTYDLVGEDVESLNLGIGYGIYKD